VLLHESAHARIDVNDLAFTGCEEDAADQLATLVLLGDGGDVEAALHGAAWFYMRALRGVPTEAWDEHALDEQPFFNVVCWIYGGTPSMREELLAAPWSLPPSRAEGCPDE
jgi:hypothetical protein